jgi:hypothetical protein
MKPLDEPTLDDISTGVFLEITARINCCERLARF